MSARGVIERHKNSGTFIDVNGVQSFARDEGTGEPVVCIHGVPSSSFLYRKLISSLKERGFRGVSFDFPGMGLSDRPKDYDYTWTGLGKFCVNAIDALNINNFHLVVHDVGGPIGFELVSQKSDSIQSLTVLNTILRVNEFQRPWVMEPFAYPILGRIWLASMVGPIFRPIFYYFGLEDTNSIQKYEANAYVKLLKRKDEGNSFLKIMKGFERTLKKQGKYITTLKDADYPIQAIWGENDPALPPSPYLNHFKKDIDLNFHEKVKARHFLQEEKPDKLADRIMKISQ